MLTIICGEDIVASRNFLLGVQSDYKKKSIEINSINADEIFELTRWLADSPSLFSEKKAFFTEFLNKKIKKGSKKLLSELERVSKLKDIELVVWEDVASRELKTGKIGRVKEFKPAKTIFKLLDTLYPGNKKSFINSLNLLIADIDENFIFLMLARHVKNLILAKQEIIPDRMQAWQFGKLRYQAKLWKFEQLLNFYEGLYRIDVASKTGKSPYTVSQSLDILACYYL